MSSSRTTRARSISRERSECRLSASGGRRDERYSTPVTPYEDSHTVADAFRAGVLPPVFSGRLSDRSPLHETNPHRAGPRCGPPVSPGESRVSHPAVFLDRDGTMIEDVGYLDRLERLKLFPYTIDAIRLLNRAGYKVVVVTSQNGVAQGVLTEEFLGEAHAHLSQLCEAAGAKIDGYYYCPHSTHAVGRALPDRLRMPETEARYDTGGRAGPFARRLEIVRRRRPLARHRDGVRRRHAGRCWSKQATAAPKQRGVRRISSRCLLPERSSKQQAGFYVIRKKRV